MDEEASGQVSKWARRRVDEQMREERCHDIGAISVT